MKRDIENHFVKKTGKKKKKKKVGGVWEYCDEESEYAWSFFSESEKAVSMKQKRIPSELEKHDD